MKDRYLLCSVV